MTMLRFTSICHQSTCQKLGSFVPTIIESICSLPKHYAEKHLNDNNIKNVVWQQVVNSSVWDKKACIPI